MGERAGQSEHKLAERSAPLILSPQETVTIWDSNCELVSPPTAGGEYFSDEQMRSRDPLLYEQYIGQYLDDDEIQALGGCKLETSCSLSGVLLDTYQEQIIQRRLQIQQEEEEACQQEEEEDDGDDPAGWSRTEAESGQPA